MDNVKGSTQLVVDVLLRVIILFAMLAICVLIIKPFYLILLWASIFSIGLFPLVTFICNKFKLSVKIVSIVIVSIILILFAVPTVVFSEALVAELKILATFFKSTDFHLPPPDESVKQIPLVGDLLYKQWYSASDNLELYFTNNQHILDKIGEKLLHLVLQVSEGLFTIFISIILCGVFMIYNKTLTGITSKFFIRLIPKHHVLVNHTIVKSIMSVFKGVIGVALIQTLSVGAALFLFDVPYAGVWTFITLFFAVLQIGLIPVAITLVLFLIYINSTVLAIGMGVWIALVALSEHVLKPILLGKGSIVPMPIIFIGVIGGFIALGFSGMFIGAIIFSIVYNLFIDWIHHELDEKEIK
jgi:predicted PurR-regulated permease PerM